MLPQPVTDRPPVILGLGEVLWDLFPSGPRFGGAPANFVCHAAPLGAEAHLLSAVGPEELGDQACRELADRGVGISALQRRQEPTGTVTVELDAAGVPSYTFAENTAWDHLAPQPAADPLLARADCLCYGTLARRAPNSRATLEAWVAQANALALRVFDINLRPPFFEPRAPFGPAELLEALPAADLLKLNQEELAFVAELLELPAGEMNEVETARRLNERFTLQLTAVTRGAEGALLVTADGRVSSAAAEPPGPVVDTVGAGDAYTAALVVGLLRGLPLEEVNRAACRLAAYLCTQPGATPAIPEEYRLG